MLAIRAERPGSQQVYNFSLGTADSRSPKPGTAGDGAALGTEKTKPFSLRLMDGQLGSREHFWPDKSH